MSGRPTIAGPRKGRIAAFVAPGAADEVFYPIEALRLPQHRHISMVVALEGGRRPVPVDRPDPECRGGKVVRAVIKRHPTIKRDWWFQTHVWSDERYDWVRREEPLEMFGRKHKSRNSPLAFRPLDPAAWPDPLPEPMRAFGSRLPKPFERDPDEPLDPNLADDGWPHPGLPLGRLTVPLTREECEARILRAFRTSNSDADAAGGGFGLGGSSGYATDIPREFAKVALANANAEREEELRREGKVGELEAVRSGWTPSKRDIADWLFALAWLRGLDQELLRILAMRAANPPFSLRDIKKRIRVKSPTTVAKLYDRAVDHAFALARRNRQQGMTAAAAARTPDQRGKR